MKNNKKSPIENESSHLKDIFMITPAASPTDCTGFVNTPPETNDEAKNISRVMHARTSPRTDDKKK